MRGLFIYICERKIMAANKKIIGRRIMIKHKKRDFKIPPGAFQGLFKARYMSTPYRGRGHVTLRAAIPIRFACAARRKTPVFVRSGVQKHAEFQVGL